MRYGQRRVRRRMYLAECAQRLLVERTQPKSADVARPVVALRDGVIIHGLCADPADLLAIVRERDLRQLTGYCHRRIGGGAHSSSSFILRPISLGTPPVRAGWFAPRLLAFPPRDRFPFLPVPRAGSEVRVWVATSEGISCDVLWLMGA